VFSFLGVVCLNCVSQRSGERVARQALHVSPQVQFETVAGRSEQKKRMENNRELSMRVPGCRMCAHPCECMCVHVCMVSACVCAGCMRVAVCVPTYLCICMCVCG
jgi:hypothetical protein